MKENTFHIHINYEHWRLKENLQGQTHWRCSKHQTFKCIAHLIDHEDIINGSQHPDHTRRGNVATALARRAIGNMKQKIAETVVTPSSSSEATFTSVAFNNRKKEHGAGSEFQ